jgi:hypothetical protein
MQLEPSHHIKLEQDVFKNADAVALIINDNLLLIPGIHLILSIIIKTTQVDTITL